MTDAEAEAGIEEWMDESLRLLLRQLAGMTAAEIAARAREPVPTAQMELAL